MIQVKEFADELINRVTSFHFHVHCQKECQEKLKHIFKDY